MTIYQCLICGWVYDETKGSPEDGLAPGTRWADIPADWECPVCGASKGDFEMVAVEAEPAGSALPASVGGSAPLVIIGTGLAAYTLAREFRKLDGSSPLMLVSRDGGGYYSKPALSNALAMRMTPTQLEMKSAEQMATELRAQIRVGSEIVGIDPERRRLTFADGSLQDFDRLVIAWGADPMRLALAGDGAGAVQSINDLDDYRRFRASLEKARSVAVIGAGLIGCEFASDLAGQGLQTRLIGRTAWPLDRLLPEDAGKVLAARLQSAGIEFLANTSVTSVTRSDAGYQLALADGRTILADLILSAIGLRPRTALAEAAGISCRRSIVTDRRLETNMQGIYAVGDCAEVAGLNLPFILPILLQTRALAQTLSGTPTEVCYPAMPVVVKTPACPVVVCPPPQAAAGNWECQAIDGGYKAYFRDPDGKLSGFALLGSATSQSNALASELPAVLG